MKYQTGLTLRSTRIWDSFCKLFDHVISKSMVNFMSKYFWLNLTENYHFFTEIGFENQYSGNHTMELKNEVIISNQLMELAVVLARKQLTTHCLSVVLRNRINSAQRFVQNGLSNLKAVYSIPINSSDQIW